jgi:transposase
MPVERIAMRQIKELLRLKEKCRLSQRQIARALKLSKGVVAKYLQLVAAAGVDWNLAQGLAEEELQARLCPDKPVARAHVQPDWALIHQELKRKGVTLQLLWEEHCAQAQGLAYGRSRFCELYRSYVGTLSLSMRQVHRAGEKLFVDFSGDTVPIFDTVGGPQRQAHIFVAALGASSYTFVCATWGETQLDWLQAIEKALRFLGGCATLIVPDNPRALVKDPDRYEPQLNRTVEEFAAHYSTAILPARPGRPRDKPKVEQAVLLAQRWVIARLRHRRFFSLGELNVAIAELLSALNERPFKKLPGNRREAFERLDQPVLTRLPETPFDYATWKKVKVNIDYHIELDQHYYSVPFALVGQLLEARVSANTVELILRTRRVAIHARSRERWKYTTVVEHMPQSHRAHAQWTPGRLIGWARGVGAGTGQFVERLLKDKPHPEHGYRACLGLMRLHKVYGAARLEAACLRALAIASLRVRSVEAILNSGFDRQPLPGQAAEAQLNLGVHENVRGPGYYH